jgi:hypothetical protein
VKDVIKLMLIPIAGSVAIGLVFLLVVWSGSFQDVIIDDTSPEPSLQRDLVGAAIIGPTLECDDSYFPVCGFDDVTYDNACLAVTAGTKVAHRGACGTPQA